MNNDQERRRMEQEEEDNRRRRDDSWSVPTPPISSDGGMNIPLGSGLGIDSHGHLTVMGISLGGSD